METSDLRHIEMMKTSIEDYEKSAVTFEVLVSQLETLFRSLTTISSDWKEKFYNNWLELETINALCLDENRKLEGSEYEKIASEKIQDLKRLVNDLELPKK